MIRRRFLSRNLRMKRVNTRRDSLMRRLDAFYSQAIDRRLSYKTRRRAKSRMLVTRDALRSSGVSYRTLRRHIGSFAFKADAAAGGETLDQVKGLLDDAGVTTSRMESLFKVLIFYAQDFLQGVTDAATPAKQIIDMLGKEGVDPERLNAAWSVTTGEKSDAETPAAEEPPAEEPAPEEPVEGEAAPEEFGGGEEEQPKRRFGVRYRNNRRIRMKSSSRRRRYHFTR